MSLWPKIKALFRRQKKTALTNFSVCQYPLSRYSVNKKKKLMRNLFYIKKYSYLNLITIVKHCTVMADNNRQLRKDETLTTTTTVSRVISPLTFRLIKKWLSFLCHGFGVCNYNTDVTIVSIVLSWVFGNKIY